MKKYHALHLLLFMHYLLHQNKFNFISAVASILDASLPNNSLRLDRVRDAKVMISSNAIRRSLDDI